MDDDTYLNVVALVKLLQRFPHHEDWYIGKPSLSKPLTVHFGGHPAVNPSAVTSSQGLELEMCIKRNSV